MTCGRYVSFDDKKRKYCSCTGGLCSMDEVVLVDTPHSYSTSLHKLLDKLSTAKSKPLHTFAPAGHIKFMDGLLEKGYNIDLLDKGGLTALHLAIICKRKPIIVISLKKEQIRKPRIRMAQRPLIMLLISGPSKQSYKVDVNAADNEGWTRCHRPNHYRGLEERG